METSEVGMGQGGGETIARAQHDAGMANACATKIKEQINMAQELFGGNTEEGHSFIICRPGK